MRTPVATTLLVLAVIGSPTRMSAQDAGDIAAYFALTLTPPGAFVPLPPPGASARGSAFVARYGNLNLGSDDGSLHNVALGGDFAMRRGRVGLTLGGTTCDGCDEIIMAGLDYTATLTRNVVAVALRPAVGFAKPTDGDGTVLSLSLSLPVGVELSGATSPIFAPFIVPGIGFGRVCGEGGSESGTRPFLGGGVSLCGRRSAFGLHVGFQKVFVQDGDMTFGVGLSIGGRASTP